MRYYSLQAYYFVFFVMNGFSVFLPKYYGEIGLSDGMIGVLGSVPTVVAMAFAPMLALLTDRVPKKRYMLCALMILLAAFYFLAARCTTIVPLLLVVSLAAVFSNPVMPLANTISLEYTQAVGKNYGHIRLMGTAGYQVGALLIGAILAERLDKLYPMMGAVVLVSCGITFLMPNVEGHQHKNGKVPLSKLFADKHVRWLYFILFFCTIPTQFFMGFFTKHLGDLGMSNTMVSWVTLLSVVLELPFLCFGDRIVKKMNTWNWIMVGMLLNTIRWIGLAFSKSLLLILIFQIPMVTVMACYEYAPAFYLNKRVPQELAGSAQSMHSLMMFGAAKIVGCLIGGQICEYTGIPMMFAICGVMGLVGCVFFWFKTRQLIKEDTVSLSAD